jgi:transketolase
MTIDPLQDKLKSFGAKTVTVEGHDIRELTEAAKTPHKNMPLVMLCRTDPMRGMAELKDNVDKLHYIRIKNEATEKKFTEILNNIRV